MNVLLKYMYVTHATTDGRAKNTGPYMHWMVDNYYQDMIPYASLTLSEIYDKIKKIPYRDDPITEELLMRPAYTMQLRGWGGDCDDKAIALASWAKLRLPPDPKTGKSYRFAAVRKPNMPFLHHVYPELYLSYNDAYLIADPTYRFNALGRQRERYIERVII